MKGAARVNPMNLDASNLKHEFCIHAGVRSHHSHKPSSASENEHGQVAGCLPGFLKQTAKVFQDNNIVIQCHPICLRSLHVSHFQRPKSGTPSSEDCVSGFLD